MYYDCRYGQPPFIITIFITTCQAGLQDLPGYMSTALKPAPIITACQGAVLQAIKPNTAAPRMASEPV